MKVVKIIQVLTGVSTLASWFWSTEVFRHFDETRPTRPDTVTGAIYPQFNHGHVVYLTAAEKQQWYGLMAAAAVLFAVTAVLSLHLYLIKRSCKRRTNGCTNIQDRTPPAD